MNEAFVFHAASESDTERLGAALAEVLPLPSVIGLIGTLGAGKTRLVQAVAAASGIERCNVVSPTYVVVHEYPGPRPIFHFDLYRLRDEDEYLELGAEEYFEQAALTFLEWADRFKQQLPHDRLDVAIVIAGTESRDFHFTPRGKAQLLAVEALRQRLGG
jgi:tRNA threonylcarbamoyladenosine biosynthesis protein TsaE